MSFLSNLLAGLEKSKQPRQTLTEAVASTRLVEPSPSQPVKSEDNIKTQLQTFQRFLKTVDVQKFEINKNETIEYELRFGSVDFLHHSKTFGYKPFISEISFKHIRSVLDDMVAKHSDSIKVTESVYDVVNYGYKKSVRFVTEYDRPSPLQYEPKSRRVYSKRPVMVPIGNESKPFSFTIERLPVRMGISYEKTLPLDSISEPDMMFVENKVLDSEMVKTTRRIHRWSYMINNEDSFLDGWQIDLSDVMTITIHKNAKTTYHSSFEFEMEYKNPVYGFDEFRISPAVIIGMALVQLQPLPLEGVFLRNVKALGNVLKASLMDGDDISRVIKHIHRFLYGSPAGGIDLQELNKPENLRLTTLIAPDFDPYVTVKVDGIRCLILVLDGNVYMCTHNTNVSVVVRIARNVKTETIIPDAIFDAEWYTHTRGVYTAFLFDVLKFQQSDYRHHTVRIRVEALTRYPVSAINSKVARIQSKEYQVPFIPDLHIGRERALTDEMRINPPTVPEGIKTDGYIFYYDERYQWVDRDRVKHKGRVYKYKPKEQLTIDFLVVENKGSYELRVHARKDQEKGARAFKKHLGSKLTLTDESLGDYHILNVLNRVGEFRYDSEKEIFILERIRPDKYSGNNIKVAWHVWRDIENPIRESTIIGNDLVLTRKFHNLFKEIMLMKYSKHITMIDIGSGRGGDLQKWKKTKVNKVYCIEPNPDNRAIFEKRYATMMKPKPMVELLSHGAEDYESVLENIDLSNVRLVTSFFSLTYFFKNKAMIDGLVKWLQECPKGTRFVGAMLDGDRVIDLFNHERELQGKSDDEYITITNPAFTMTQTSDFTSTNLFGKTIVVSIHEEDSMVKDQEEYITSFSYLRDRLSRAGFKLNTKKIVTTSGSHEPFLDENYGHGFDKLNEYGKIWSRLNRYFIFTKVTDPVSVEKVKQTHFTGHIAAPFEVSGDYPREGSRVDFRRTPAVTPNARYIQLYPMGTPSFEVIVNGEQVKDKDGKVLRHGYLPLDYHPLIIAFKYASSATFRKAIISRNLEVIRQQLRSYCETLKQSVELALEDIQILEQTHPGILGMTDDEIVHIVQNEETEYNLDTIRDLRAFHQKMAFQIEPMIRLSIDEQIRRRQSWNPAITEESLVNLIYAMEDCPGFLKLSEEELRAEIDAHRFRIDDHLVINAYTFYRRENLETVSSTDARHRFLMMLTSPEDVSQIPSNIIAFLISRLVKSAVVVLTTMGDYWSITDQGLSFDEALVYKTFIPFYKPPEQRWIYYPLVVHEDGKFHTVAISKLPLWVHLQSPKHRRIDDIYLKAVDLMAYIRALKESTEIQKSESTSSKQWVRDLPEVADTVEGQFNIMKGYRMELQREMASIDVSQLHDEDLENAETLINYISERSKEVDAFIVETQSIIISLRGESQMDEEDEIINEMVGYDPVEDIELGEVVEEYEPEYLDTYDPRFG